MYAIDYIAYELHLLYKIQIVKEICPKPIFQHPILTKHNQNEQIRVGNVQECHSVKIKNSNANNYTAFGVGVLRGIRVARGIEDLRGLRV